MRLRLALCAVTVAATGCYRTYTGFYYLPKYAADGSPTTRGLVQELEAAVQPYGFGQARVNLGPDTLLYVNKTSTDVHREGRVRVVIDLEEPSVLVGDLDHDYETSFIHSLKESIEKRLKERYGMTELKFVRHVDLFE